MATDIPKNKYDGNCHCGAVKYTVECSALDQGHEVSSCNCSICSRNGYLLIYCPKSDVKIHSGEDQLKGYLFGKKRIEHRFCPTCGVNVFIMSVDPDFFPDYLAINVRTFKDAPELIDKLTLKKADGRSHDPPYEI